MPYSESTEYAKFLKKKCEEESGCGCSQTQEGCGCCPPGLVAVEDKDANNIACLTPNDAELFMKNSFRCPDGYIRVIDAGTGMFIGCLTPEEYAVYKAVP